METLVARYTGIRLSDLKGCIAYEKDLYPHFAFITFCVFCTVKHFGEDIAIFN